MRTAAILPVKRFSLAKQRLGKTVDDPLRADLARAMVGDVLVALSQSTAIELTVVVTNEPSVAAAARYIGAIVAADTTEDGQSAAVAIGIERALAEGAERALCVPGDCPALDPSELTELLTAGEPGEIEGLLGTAPVSAGTSGADVDALSTGGLARARNGRTRTREAVIVPDRHGSGTNGLLLTPPDALSPSFGPDSRARHERLAREAGAAWRIERPASLLLDIDTGEDLAVLRERLAGERVRAPRTRAVLGRSDERRSEPDESAGTASVRSSRTA
jgi:2-phospho-L-lactate guanylyltransferase